ncbi:DUF6502 family protein [Elongatibacter sediminis]|uniref:DUF6502 family protein n=1 Tax=Elongatibacter sediminis TaxID=3119006 RepID=A0AAW9RGH4_9GAMM
MSDPRNDELTDVAILTRSVENVFRKLIRFLVGRISLVKLQEIIRVIFIEEVEDQLRLEFPNRNVSLTKLALATGLDTRTIVRIKNSSQFRKPFFNTKNFLAELTPVASILDVWSSKSPYYDEKTGLPRELDIMGPSGSFEALFSSHIKSRGVTPKSLISQLLKSDTVELSKSGEKIRLKKRAYLPAQSVDKQGAIEMGFGAIGSLVNTVHHNISSQTHPDDRFYQQGAWTLRLPANRRKAARAELRTLLENTDDQARTILAKYEEPHPNSQQLTVGVSCFYFEDGI